MSHLRDYFPRINFNNITRDQYKDLIAFFAQIAATDYGVKSYKLEFPPRKIDEHTHSEYTFAQRNGTVYAFPKGLDSIIEMAQKGTIYGIWRTVKPVNHEMTHVVQDQEEANPNSFHPYATLFAKEHLVWQAFPASYNPNHSVSITENDANIESEYAVVRNFSRLFPEGLRIFGDLKRFNTTFQEEIRNFSTNHVNINSVSALDGKRYCMEGPANIVANGICSFLLKNYAGDSSLKGREVLLLEYNRANTGFVKKPYDQLVSETIARAEALIKSGHAEEQVVVHGRTLTLRQCLKLQFETMIDSDPAWSEAHRLALQKRSHQPGQPGPKPQGR